MITSREAVSMTPGLDAEAIQRTRFAQKEVILIVYPVVTVSDVHLISHILFQGSWQIQKTHITDASY
jgi:hypothetical protein